MNAGVRYRLCAMMFNTRFRSGSPAEGTPSGLFDFFLGSVGMLLCFPVTIVMFPKVKFRCCGSVEDAWQDDGKMGQHNVMLVGLLRTGRSAKWSNNPSASLLLDYWTAWCLVHGYGITRSLLGPSFGYDTTLHGNYAEATLCASAHPEAMQMTSGLRCACYV